MKIAIDIRTAGGEKVGKGWYTFNLVYNLLKIDSDFRRHGDDKNEYLLYCKDPIPGFEEFKNARLIPIKGKGVFWHRKVAKDVVKNDADIFFAPSSFIIPALLPENIKKIVTVHDLVAFLFPNKHNKKAVFIEKIFLKKVLKKANLITTVSENTKKDLIEKFDYDPDKIKVINCAAGYEFKPIAKTEELQKFKKKTNLPSKFFLAVGTLEPRKNFITLIKAFAILQKTNPEFYLIIVGGKGWEYDEIFKIVREKYLEKKVHFLGYISGKSLANLYNLAHAFVFPSLYEGFGIPPLEAMQSGCPVIASNTSSIPEVVGNAALTVDPRDETRLAEAMQKLIQSPDLRDDLISRGLTQSKKFSWEQSAKKLLELF